MFLPDAAKPELPEGPHRLPLSLCPASLYWYLSNEYRQRASAARRAAKLPSLDAAAYNAGQSLSVGYELQRVWLDAMFGHLGGARGRIPVQLPVQRALENARQHRRVPVHVGTCGAGHCCDVASCDQGSWRERDEHVAEICRCASRCRDEASSYQASSRFYLPDFLWQEMKVDAKLSEDDGGCHFAPISCQLGHMNGLPDCNGLAESNQPSRASHVPSAQTAELCTRKKGERQENRGAKARGGPASTSRHQSTSRRNASTSRHNSTTTASTSRPNSTTS